MATVELIRGLAVLAEPPGPQVARLAELLGLSAAPLDWQYTELFVEQLYPYASVYLGAEGKMGGAARDRVAGFWRALGETPPNEPDHLVVLLGLYAHLGELEQDAEQRRQRDAWRRARAALLWEHLLSWLPIWLGKLGEIAPAPYQQWGALLTEALEADREQLQMPELLPLQLREAPALPGAAGQAGAEFLEHLLAAVRTGFILTRSDLVDCATDLGLAVRAGERRYVLKALLAQAPADVLGWLATLARRQALRYGDADPIARFWGERAAAGAAILEMAAADA